MTFQPPEPVATVLEGVRDRRYVLPAIQREFVWTTDQIRLLFDSLMREYPIGSFLFWTVAPETASDFTFYDFLTDYHEKDNPYAPRLPNVPGQGVTAILDGQQRLTALNIGLYGSHAERIPRRWGNNPDAYPKKRLYLNLLERPPSGNELGLVYEFRFLTDSESKPADGAPDKWYRVGDVLKLPDAGPAAMQALKARSIDLNELDAYQMLHRLYRAIREVPAINYYLVKDQDPDKVLDIFVRVNSAGTTLSYSDLLLSMATNQWKDLDAREEVRSLVKILNADCSSQFNFSKDRVLKAGLVLTEVPDVGFKVSNFTSQNMAKMEASWAKIQSALTVAASLLASFGFNERTLTADSVLIPLAYYVHHRGLDSSYVTSSAEGSDRLAVKRWVLRSLMKRGIWGSGLDTLLTRLRDTLRQHAHGFFPAPELEQAMAGLGKSLQFEGVELEELTQLKYGGPRTFAVLATLYPGLDLSKSFHEDHIFPRSLFTRARLRDEGMTEAEIDSFVERCDQLPNLQLLAGLPNIEKQAKLPGEWLGGPNFPSDEQRRNYMADNDLEGLPLSLASWNEFFEGRRARMVRRLSELLGIQTTADTSAQAGN